MEKVIAERKTGERIVLGTKWPIVTQVTRVQIPDTRPRVPFVLPDGTVVSIIFDVGEEIPSIVPFQIKGGSIVEARRVRPAVSS